MLTAEKIREIVDELDGISDLATCYLNRTTGQVYTIVEEMVSGFDEDTDIDSLSEWQRQDYLLWREIEETDNWLPLPSKFAIHEWSIMNDFSRAQEDDECRKELLDAIHGAGAFRLFNRLIRQHDIEDQWYEFKRLAISEIVIQWLDSKGIAYAHDESL
jgi:hypothetical protein